MDGDRTEDFMSAEEFTDKFAEKAREIKPEVGHFVGNEAKKYFTVERADKLWVAALIGGVWFMRNRRLQRKIKELKKIVQLLNLENEFLHSFVTGMTNPKINKEKLIEDLSTKFQFITLVKDL